LFCHRYPGMIHGVSFSDVTGILTRYTMYLVLSQVSWHDTLCIFFWCHRYPDTIQDVSCSVTGILTWYTVYLALMSPQ